MATLALLLKNLISSWMCSPSNGQSNVKLLYLIKNFLDFIVILLSGPCDLMLTWARREVYSVLFKLDASRLALSQQFWLYELG